MNTDELHLSSLQLKQLYGKIPLSLKHTYIPSVDLFHRHTHMPMNASGQVAVHEKENLYTQICVILCVLYPRGG